MFKDIGALWIDHVAVTTDRFEETARHYLAMPNARTLRGPGWNSSQKVHFLFVSFGGDLCVEILGVPENGDSPIAAHAASGGGAYHLCYAVVDVDQALIKAQACGARVVVGAKPDDAYDGRRVAFLMHPAHGLFEVVDAYGDFAPQPDDVLQSASAVAAPSSRPQSNAGPVKGALELRAAFKKIFPKTLPAEPAQWTVANVKGWDSLAHMRLIMEVERRLDITIPSGNLSRLKGFEDFLALLAQQS